MNEDGKDVNADDDASDMDFYIDKVRIKYFYTFSVLC